jgi:hypothetical protein
MSQPSAIYLELSKALAARTTLSRRYGGKRRVICPIILGHSNGAEMVLVYQIAGDTSTGPLLAPQWKCLRLAELSDLAPSDLPWRSGQEHGRAQHCVRRVEHDVNPASPYRHSAYAR